MKKKLWIRGVGLLSILAWVWTYAMWHAAATTYDTTLRAEIVIFCFLSAAAAGLMTAVWALFSVIDWALRRQAKLRAADLRLQAAGELLRRSASVATPREPERKPGPPASSAQAGERSKPVMTSPLGLS